MPYQSRGNQSSAKTKAEAIKSPTDAESNDLLEAKRMKVVENL
jgi:hypothetical protein